MTEYRFERYQRGVLKAEGIGIGRATDIKDAYRRAAILAQPGDVLVLVSVGGALVSELEKDKARIDYVEKHLKRIGRINVNGQDRITTAWAAASELDSFRETIDTLIIDAGQPNDG